MTSVSVKRWDSDYNCVRNDAAAPQIRGWSATAISKGFWGCVDGRAIPRGTKSQVNESCDGDIRLAIEQNFLAADCRVWSMVHIMQII
jgi:hypothetical protein